MGFRGLGVSGIRALGFRVQKLAGKAERRRLGLQVPNVAAHALQFEFFFHKL